MRRRGFLIASLGVVGAGALACGGVATVGLRPPVTQFAEPSCGEGSPKRALVAYASKCGATAEIAAAVGAQLCGAGIAIDVRSVRAVTDVTPYAAVVIGSAARMGKLLPEAVRFVEQHRADLQRLPVAYFFSGSTMNVDTPDNRQEAAAYLQPLRDVKASVSEGFFGGKVDRAKLELVWRVPLSFVRDGDMAEGDHRDLERHLRLGGLAAATARVERRNHMAGKVLVAYGSWCGSTAEVAEEIGKVLAAAGAQVDVMPAGKVTDVSPYRGVVLGTAIRAGRPNGAVTKLVGKQREALRRMPVALFNVCGQMNPPTDENRTKAESFILGLRDTLKPASVAVFAGAIVPERLKFPMSLFMRSAPAGDWRDWDAIRGWATSLMPVLGLRG